MLELTTPPPSRRYVICVRPLNFQSGVTNKERHQKLR